MKDYPLLLDIGDNFLPFPIVKQLIKQNLILDFINDIHDSNGIIRNIYGQCYGKFSQSEYSKRFDEYLYRLTNTALCDTISERQGAKAMRLFNKKRSQKERFINIVEFGQELIKRSDHSSEGTEPVFALIKMLADNIIYDTATELISTDEIPNEKSAWDYFLDTNSVVSAEKVWDLLSSSPTIEADFEISLATDAVISFPWEKTRLLNNLCNIGDGMKYGEWEQDTANHTARVYLPFGLCAITNGNHSTFTGVVKREGKLTVDNKRITVYDVSKLYEYIYCDGENYRRKSDNKIVCKSKNFEFACIFEIGRAIINHNRYDSDGIVKYKGVPLGI